MRIEIDTKEDLHNIRHIMRLLQAISAGTSGRERYHEDMFSESSTPAPTPVQETSPTLFNMFDSAPASSPSSDLGIPGIFQEKKNDEDNSKDFLDSLQVY